MALLYSCIEFTESLENELKKTSVDLELELCMELYTGANCVNFDFERLKTKNTVKVNFSLVVICICFWS